MIVVQRERQTDRDRGTERDRKTERQRHGERESVGGARALLFLNILKPTAATLRLLRFGIEVFWHRPRISTVFARQTVSTPSEKTFLRMLCMHTYSVDTGYDCAYSYPRRQTRKLRNE